jgi:hypothetical protein
MLRSDDGANTIGEFAGLSPQERAVDSLYIDALGRPGSVAELVESRHGR